MKKIIFGIILFLNLIGSIRAFELSSKQAVLYNMNEDKIIYELNKEEEISIASLTKIMTTLVAIETIKNYNEQIKIDSSIFLGLEEANAAVIGLKNGQFVTYNDLLYGMFLASGADATRAIVISIFGSEAIFVEQMNEKAESLGMNHTHFLNTIGLDEEGQYSTVNDVAILLKEAFKNEKFREIFTTTSYTFQDRSFTIYSTIRKTAIKYGYDIGYIIGAKTGYTNKAGKCLASIAIDQDNNIQYLLVTANASTETNDAYHIKDAVTIYKHYFDHYKYHSLIEKGDLLITIPIKYGKQKTMDIYASQDIPYYLNNEFDKQDVKLRYTGIDIVTPNMNQNEKLGIIEIIYHDEILNTFDLYLPQKVDFSLLAFLKDHWLGILGIMISFIIIVTIIKKRLLFMNIWRKVF